MDPIELMFQVAEQQAESAYDAADGGAAGQDEYWDGYRTALNHISSLYGKMKTGAIGGGALERKSVEVDSRPF